MDILNVVSLMVLIRLVKSGKQIKIRSDSFICHLLVYVKIPWSKVSDKSNYNLVPLYQWLGGLCIVNGLNGCDHIFQIHTIAGAECPKATPAKAIDVTDVRHVAKASVLV